MTLSEDQAKTMRFTIASDFTASRDVQRRVIDEVERQAYSHGVVFAIKLALEEAVVNAIKHGNKYDPSKKVHIEATVTPKQTTIAVEDEGVGFDRESVPDPRDEINLEKCSGRGILLIEAYMSEVSWSNKGRRIIMVRTNEPDVTAKPCV